VGGFDFKRAGWKVSRQEHLLNAWTDDAKAYAGAVFDRAAAVADEAAHAALEALLARNDAKVAALPENRASDNELNRGAAAQSWA
jgi:hypothetical protein